LLFMFAAFPPVAFDDSRDPAEQKVRWLMLTHLGMCSTGRHLFVIECVSSPPHPQPSPRLIYPLRLGRLASVDLAERLAVATSVCARLSDETVRARPAV
jgi:hypothetical protein